MDDESWADAHRRIISISTYCRARDRDKRMPVQEPLLALDPQIAYLYSLKVLRTRFKEGEAAISKSPEWAVRYARFVLKGRFVKAEGCIMQSAYWSYEYAQNVVGGRLPPRMHRRMASMVDDHFARKYMEEQLCRRSEKD